MAQVFIKQKRIHSLKVLEGLKKEKIVVAVPVLNNEDQKVGLSDVGDVTLPTGEFGAYSRKNAYGYSYADKSKPKEWRNVATISIHPFGNENASEQLIDIYRECYQRIKVAPYGLELELIENSDKERFVIVVLNHDISEDHLLHAINLMLEIYGECYVFEEGIKINHSVKRTRRNWELLPKGEKPSRHIRNQQRKNGKAPYTFNIQRLEYIEECNPTEIAEGINGFKGYYAYLLNSCCVLESAFYGNATYIIPKDGWEKLSQKTKQELLDEKVVLAKVNHTKSWQEVLSKELEKINIMFN